MNQKHQLDSEEMANYEKTLNEVIDLFSDRFEYGIQPERNRYLLIIKTVLPYIIGRRAKILDGGCGGGIMSLVFKRMGYDVSGVHNWKSYASTDANHVERMQRERLEREGVHTEDLDIVKDLFPFQNDSFDVILFLGVIEHLHSSPRNALREIHRVLKRGGILILTTPNLATLKNRLYVLAGKSNYVELEYWYNSVPFFGHVREYAVDEIKQILAWGGFDVKRVKLSNCMQLSIIKKIRSNPVKAIIMLLYLVLPMFIPRLRYMMIVIAQK